MPRIFSAFTLPCHDGGVHSFNAANPIVAGRVYHPFILISPSANAG